MSKLLLVILLLAAPSSTASPTVYDESDARGKVLKDSAAMASFKNGKIKLDAQASAVALTERAADDLAYRDGVAIVTMAKGGLMYEASVGTRSSAPLEK